MKHSIPTRFVFAFVAALGLALGNAAFQGPSGALQAATPRPLESVPPTPPPITATATPTPEGRLIRFSGQLIDVQRGYVFFTTGDAFRLAGNYRVVDPNGHQTTLKLEPGVYARAAFDSNSGQVVELALSNNPLPSEAGFEDVRRFVVVLSTPAPNPELGGGEGFSGRDVLVTFVVQVPPRTPFGDTIYLATDVSGWSATAIRMDRVDSLHYRITQTFRSGTRFFYRYTRGSWQSAERGQNGLEVPPRPFLVGNNDVQTVTNVVYHWGDEQSSAPDLGGAIPTPYNPVPFQTPRPAKTK